MSQVDIYNNILNILYNSILPELSSTINNLNNVVNNVSEALVLDGNSYQKERLERISSELDNERDYIVNGLIPAIKTAISECENND